MKKVLKGFLAIFLAVVMSFGSLLTESSFGSLFDINAEAANAYQYTLLWPVNHTTYSISSHYGMRNIDGKQKMHYGMDIQYAGNILAVYDGVIIDKTTCKTKHFGSSGDCGGNGTSLAIYHPKLDITSYYCHMKKDSNKTLNIGDSVVAGQKIGYMGDTGNAGGVHLHFQLAKGKITKPWNAKGNGVTINPMPYTNKYVNSSTKDCSFISINNSSQRKTVGSVNYVVSTNEFVVSNSNATYIITFNANGASISYSPIYVTKGKTYGTLPTPTRNGYKFDGWYTKASGGTKVTTSTKVTSSHTLYAHWSKIPSSLTVNSITVSNISQNSAKVSAKYSYTGSRPSEVSVYIGTSKTSLKKYSSDKINHTKNPFDVWYNIKNLKPGITYYYQFHAVVNGTDKACSEIKSFKTSPIETSSLTMNVKGASKITKNSARVDATCSYKGTRPSEVSVYIGTSKNNMKKYSSDAINHSKNPFNIWYNLTGLKKNTTYYYQFHAKVSGVDKAYGEIKSFKTTK